MAILSAAEVVEEKKERKVTVEESPGLFVAQIIHQL